MAGGFFIMKKSITCFILLFFLMSGAFCEKLGIVLTPSVSVDLSKNGEYIFSTSGRRLYSYLEWNAQPLIQVGFETSIIYKYLNISFGNNFAIPGDFGQMFDSDWNSYSVKTTYSIHKNNASCNYNLYTILGFSIPVKKFKITPEIGLFYYYDYFHAHDGYGWYGGEAYSLNGEDNSWDSIYARKATKLYPVDLTRKTFDVLMGLKLSYSPIQKLSFTIGSYIVFFSYVHSYDYHYAKPDSSNDFSIIEIQNAFFSRFKEAVNISYAINNKYAINLAASYLFGDVIQGELYDGDELTTQKSGSDIYDFSISLSLSILL